MGGDGGQVIDRATMVKCKGMGLTKESGGRHTNSLGEMNSYLQMVSEDRGLGHLERHRTRMRTCWLSQQPLREPVVCCRLGNLYNKEALMTGLLNKTLPKEMDHVRGLKDVKACLLTWKEAEKEEGRKAIVCPISRDDLDAGSSRAVVIWSTGAVVSAKSLKELKLTDCPMTGKTFDAKKDIIPLASDGEELAKLRENLPAAKKRKSEATSATGDAAAAGSKTGQTPASSGGDVDKAVKQPELALKKQKAAGDDETKSGVYRSLFTGSGGRAQGPGNGFTGTRDAFGTPAYNRGMNIS